MVATRTRQSPTAFVLAAITALSCGGGASSGSGGSSGGNSALQSQVLSDVADHVVRPTLVDFAASAVALADAVGDLDEALRDAEGEVAVAAARQDAQQAWRASTLLWQQLEVMQVGPAASSSHSPAGQFLRDEIYSWPTVSPCGIDQQLEKEGYAEADFVNNRLVDVYGLDALEYLLFHTEPGNGCSAQAALNRDGLWAALTEEEIALRRAAYARVVASQVGTDADRLLDAWDDFTVSFTGAGNSSSDYLSTQDALQELFGALYYIELSSKDLKLGIPGGLQGCDVPPCVLAPEQLESRWAEHSRENVHANLQAARALLSGGDGSSGTGFADLLEDAGAEDFSAQMLANLDAAIDEADGGSQSYSAALAAQDDDVTAMYATVKAFTDQLRGEFATLLELDIPGAGAGDND